MFVVKVKPHVAVIGGRKLTASSVGDALAFLGHLHSGMPREPLVAPVGMKPPQDTATEGWTWAEWRREQSANELPGWPFCRFANRLGRDRAEFVFGHAKGSFGVWQKPYRVCVGDDGPVMVKLTAITHLASGHGIGVFDSRETAAAAAEIADRVADWTGIDPERPDTWHEVYNRTSSAWGGIGIRTMQGRHCHDDGSPPMYIFGRSDESVMEGRPEKLS